MAKSQTNIFNPFGNLIDLTFVEAENGRSTFTLEIAKKHLNPHRFVHGGVIYAMADTGMGAAVYSTLNQHESCTTIEIKINYLRGVNSGLLTCNTQVIYRGRTTAVLESEIEGNGRLLAKATGTFYILI